MRNRSVIFGGRVMNCQLEETNGLSGSQNWQRTSTVERRTRVVRETWKCYYVVLSHYSLLTTDISANVLLLLAVCFVGKAAGDVFLHSQEELNKDGA